MICSNCQQTNPANSKFCNHCGSKLTVVMAQRRQLTVLFCDLIGSTALSEELDPEDYREVILGYQQVAEGAIKLHGGHIAQYLGDGLLVYFGYPEGLEDAPRAGVRAGLEIIGAVHEANQRWAAAGKTQINIRLGIHSGLVVIDDHLALGETLNIAARLEALAPVNSLVISSATQRLVSGWFATESLGQKRLKGISKPMEVFRVLSESDAQTRLDIRRKHGFSPFVGRQEEMKLLKQKWNFAKSNRGQLVLIGGAAGIGKSRLTASLKEAIKFEGNPHPSGQPKHTRLEIFCSSQHIHSPFYPLIDLLKRKILVFGKEETPEAMIEKLIKWLEKMNFSIELYLPIYTEFLSIPKSTDLRFQLAPSMLPPPVKRKNFTSSFSSFLLNKAQTNPLLLVVEDLHWMDASTLEWLQHFNEQLPTNPILCLATTRPNFQLNWPKQDHLAEIELEGLSENGTEAICAHQTKGKTLPKEVLQQIKEKTDGVPLFVEELTRMVIESDWLEEKEHSFELRPRFKSELPVMAIPATLQDSLVARLDRLQGVKRIAQIGAVLGREFSFELLQAVTQQDKQSLDEALSKLVSAEMLYLRGFASSRTYLFKHALIQDVAYESLLRSQRQQLHQQVVHAFNTLDPNLSVTQPELLAHHLEGAGLADQAVPFWKKAGELAIQQNATLEAIQHLQTGFNSVGEIKTPSTKHQQKYDLLLLLWSCTILVKGYFHEDVKELVRQLHQSAEELGGTTPLFSAQVVRILTSMSGGEFQNALGIAEEMLELANASHNKSLLAVSYHYLGAQKLVLGRFTEAKKHFEEAIELNQREPETSIFIQLNHGKLSTHLDAYYLMTLGFSGYPKQALNIVHKLFDIAKSSNSNIDLYYAAAFTSVPLQLLKEYELCEQILFPAHQTAIENDDLFWAFNLSFHKNRLLGVQGDKKALKEAHFLAHEIGKALKQGYAYHLIIIAEAYLEVGDYDEGMKALQEATSIMKKTGEHLGEPERHRIEGEFRLRNNESPDVVEKYFLRALQLAQEQSAKWHELLAAISLSRFWMSHGSTQKAYEILNDVYQWFTEGFELNDMMEAEALLAELRNS